MTILAAFSILAFVFVLGTIISIIINAASESENDRTAAGFLSVLFFALSFLLCGLLIERRTQQEFATLILLNKPLPLIAKYVDHKDGTRTIEFESTTKDKNETP